MPGIRITHASEHDVDYALPLLDRPLNGSLYCHVCDHTYTTKHYHLRLDTQGAVIVSDEILSELAKVGYAGFTIGNVVNDPPTQGIRNENEPNRVPVKRARPVRRTN